MKRLFCSQCGQSVALRTIDDRERIVCTRCDIIFYDNPLPVAASIVLNEQREVLLVKRKRGPYRGEWCLPMGFAETGETIAEAALRELKEETGIDARVHWLIDTDSFESEIYGDLLIVTFEMEKLHGVESPGDDAVDVRYFALDDLPPLPFASNQKALRTCADLHFESWAIEDSFIGLETGVGKTLLSDNVLRLITRGAKRVAQTWLSDVLSNPTTPAYRALPADQLAQRAAAVVSQLGRWLKGDEAAEEIRAFYHSIGRERQAQGFELSEIVSAQTLLKKHVWEHARSMGPRHGPLEAYGVLELSVRISVFFDRALYHTTRGYYASRRERF
ncbi:MAG: NUDIX domain-containing protein [Acidobacteriota bacterium]|nr:MAG: NUDIX domain-containing protein [Acidobacteriota bacterium]